ncbi:MAG: hypothetical protein DRO01_04080 [Thermoproteota archaeon]|nr:MAG: hypothetical protein DRO01_04080 [Candidatus Korarchaeota archaeon]
MNETLAYALIGLVSAAAMLTLTSGLIMEAAERIDRRLTASSEWTLGGAVSNCVSAVIGGGTCRTRVFVPAELVVETKGGQVVVWDNESLAEFTVEFPVEVKLLNGQTYPWHPENEVCVVRGFVWVEAAWADGTVLLEVRG